MDYILRLRLKNVTRLLTKARVKYEEDMAWDVYLVIYPNMTEETYLSFEDFYNPKPMKPIKKKTDEEILKEVKEIINTFNGGEENGDI